MNHKQFNGGGRSYSSLSVVLRTVLFSLLIVALTFTTLFASSYFTGEVTPRIVPKGIPAAGDTLRAFTVSTGENGDFPGKPDISANAQRDQLDDMADFAATYGFNAIFFEAAPDGGAFYRSSLLPSSAYWTGTQGEFTFFDPLGYLVDRCKEQGIQVYATVNPVESGTTEQKDSLAAKHAAWLTEDGHLDLGNKEVQALLAEVSGELTKNYDIAGVVFTGLDAGSKTGHETDPAAVQALLKQARTQLADDAAQKLGVVADAESLLAQGADFFTSPLQDGSLDFVVTVTGLDPVEDTAAMTEQLAAWQKLMEKTGGDFYSLHPAGDDTFTSHQAENAAWLEKQYDAGGLVVDGYGSLNTERRLAAVSLAASFRETQEANMPSFEYPQTFAITRPTDTLTLDASWESYFITGTAVPGQTITCEGAEIEPTSTGLWGHQVKLVTGTNTFTFTQGQVSKTVKIVRPAAGSGSGLTGISKSSVYPQSPEVVLEGAKLKLSCTVPAGGTVTAQVGNLTATLKPVADAAQGTATTYQALLDVSSLGKDGEMTDIGKVTYKLNIDGMNSSLASPGSVYVTGKGATPVAQMQPFGAMVNQNAANDGAYVSILRNGCVDVITENANGYYGLSLGGYILKSAVTIPTGKVDATSRVSSIALQKTERGEKLVISGTQRSSYVGAYKDGVLTVTLRSIENWENMNTAALQSELCESVRSLINEDGSVTLTFTLNNPEEFLGWDMVFEGNDLAIYLKRKPDVHLDTVTPLSDVTIVLDPGHGGTDPGAMGIPGTTGPAENLLNLANSYALRSRLEAMGATVHILQEDSVRTLDERLQLAQKFDADFFISSHHNSTSEAADSNTASGVEVYFWNDASKDFAQSIGDNLAAQTGRKLRGIEQSWYRVTMMEACPAVLVESGFINNPSEYEDIANDFAMYRYGTAVADAVLQYLL